VNIKRTTWILFLGLSVISLGAWWRYSYPQLAFTNFSIDRQKAVAIAKQYLEEEQNEDTSRYRTAAVFEIDENANRYLQKTIGYDGLIAFVKNHEFDMFFWVVRFFKEREKEGYNIFVSSATGEIIGFRHIIEDNLKIDVIKRNEARRRAVKILDERYGFDPKEHYVVGDFLNNFDYRADYSFSWMKKDVAIPWSEEENSGIGKLIYGAKISGDKILSFYKGTFQVPAQFTREISQLKNTGHNLSTLVHIFYIFIFTASIYFVIIRRNHLAMHSTKKFYLGAAIISFVLTILMGINQFQSMLFDYQTTSPLIDYFARIGVNTVFHGVFISVLILTPSLSGELLRFEQFKDKKQCSLLYYIQSTFFSRNVFYLICFSYLVCIILLGIQSILFEIGQTYWGVWKEYNWVTHLTTAYFPFLAAFTVGYKASLNEELIEIG